MAVIGASVTRFREGDPVAIAWLRDACGYRGHCVTGWATLCENQHKSGYSVNGSFSEYAIGPAAYVVWLPAGAGFGAIAPILCADVTTYKGIKGTEARAGEWIATSSVGGLGHIAIQYAKAMGVHIAALEELEDKMALARQLGAEVAVEAAAPDAATEVTKATGGGVHGALVAAVSPAAFSHGLSLVRRKDTVSLVGLPPGDFATPIFEVVLKSITIRGSIVGTRKDLGGGHRLRCHGQSEGSYPRAPAWESERGRGRTQRGTGGWLHLPASLTR